MTAPTIPRERVVRRFRLVALVLPISIAAVLALAQLALLPLVPRTVAIHWGASGAVDGYGPSWTYPVLTLAIGAGLPLFIGGLALRGLDGPAGRRQLRFVAGMVWWATVLIGVISTGALIGQIGLARAADAPGILPMLAAGFVLGVAAGCLAARATHDLPGEEEPDPTGVVALSAGERAVWLRSATIDRGGAIVLGIAAVVLVTVSVLVIGGDLRRDGAMSGSGWITLAVALLALVLVPTSAGVRVRADETGLTVRSLVSWPRVRVPLDRIARVEVAHVDPMGEFGGWGWRYRGGWGAVLRRGEGLRVTRTDGGVFTVTVDDAATAAALLRGLKERSAA
ncbi:DUF1648 domain-containing protein [Microbacterium sp. NPDC096154]|uniref:DUF1648 domain-containing protein n=1 Tax=Microbacterium sp. NPDC096154 TaxID=3155549 RepID=UPI003329EEC8